MADFALQLDPKTFGTEQYGNFLWKNGDVQLTSPTGSGTDATIQLLTMRLRLFVAEWFCDLSAGIPYYQVVLQKGARVDEIDAVVKDCILGCPGVQALTHYQSSANKEQRLYRASFTIVTSTGGRIAATVPIGV